MASLIPEILKIMQTDMEKILVQTLGEQSLFHESMKARTRGYGNHMFKSLFYSEQVTPIAG